MIPKTFLELCPPIMYRCWNSEGDCLFEAKLKSERDVGRYTLLRPPLDPYCEAVQLGKVVAQN